jgi:signal transduction histidine kinase
MRERDMATRMTTLPIRPSATPGGDRELQDALARARELVQMGMKVAHEIRNPLAGVKALVQLGLRNPEEARSHERLAAVEEELGRIQELVQAYLSLSRPLDEVRPRAIELGPLVAETLRVLSAHAHEAGVRLVSRGDAAIEADPRRLREALVNLVSNAVEATPSGGEVRVEVRSSEDEVEIAVRDSGRGMPPEVLERIGTPFFTTREEGTGLGVALARSVVALHGGALRYASAPGQGTVATVALPRRRVAARASGTEPHGFPWL